MKYIFYNDFEIKSEDYKSVDWSGANGFCFDSEGKVAIVWEEEKGEWNLPGGGREGNENPKETFKREVLEEAQCEAVDIKYFHCVYAKAYDTNGNEVPVSENSVCFRFVCKLDNIQEFISRKDGMEIDERKFVTLEELPQYITWLEDTENGKASLQMLKDIISK